MPVFLLRCKKSRVLRIALAASAISTILVDGLAEPASVTHWDQGMEGRGNFSWTSVATRVKINPVISEPLVKL